MTEQQPTGDVGTVIQPLSILFFDIETSPMLAYVWGPKADWIPHNQILHEAFILCWAAKWAGQKTIITDKLNTTEVGERNDARIAANLAELVRQADIVVAHNSDGFDIPMLNNRILLQGLEPLGPVDSIDTLKLARKNFRLTHNKLDHLARHLGLGSKLKTDFDLWERVYNGDEVAMKEMLRYCRNDVVLLEQVFDRLRPHVSRLRRLVDGEGSFCPSCGSTNYQKRGKKRTNAGTSQQYQCLVCLRYFKDKTSDAGKRQMRPL